MKDRWRIWSGQTRIQKGTNFLYHQEAQGIHLAGMWSKNSCRSITCLISYEPINCVRRATRYCTMIDSAQYGARPTTAIVAGIWPVFLKSAMQGIDTSTYSRRRRRTMCIETNSNNSSSSKIKQRTGKDLKLSTFSNRRFISSLEPTHRPVRGTTACEALYEPLTSRL